MTNEVLRRGSLLCNIRVLSHPRRLCVVACSLALALVLPVSAETVDCTTWAAIKTALEGGKSAKLTQDVTQNSGVCVPTGTVTLDLNGHKLTRDTGGYFSRRLINVTATTTVLTIDDTSSGKTGQIAGDSAAPYYLQGDYDHGGCILASAGKVIINGGTIKGMFIDGDGYWSCGGFIQVGTGAALEMNGGTITECGGASSGGAINIASGASFTMNGGTISNCSAGQGGGVTVDGTLTMNGGTISGCTVSSDGATSGNGAALYVDGVANIYAGIITNNAAGSEGGAIRAGGVTTVYGGIFTGNKASGSTTAATALFCENVTVVGAVSDNALIGNKKASGQTCAKIGANYVIGTDIVEAEDLVVGGLFTFCPTNAEYTAIGLELSKNSQFEEQMTDPKTWKVVPLVLVELPEVDGATGQVFAFNVNGGWQAVETNAVLMGAKVHVVWTAADGKVLTGGGAKNVYRWRTAEFVADKLVQTAPLPTVGEGGASSVTIFVDTRTEKEYLYADDVLPIWAAQGNDVQVKYNGGAAETLVQNMTATNTFGWKPTENGVYEFSQTDMGASKISLITPVEVTTNDLEFAGTSVALTNAHGEPLVAQTKGEFAGKLIVSSNATVTVVWTATDADKYFRDGTKTSSTTFTADKSVNPAREAITMPEEAPKAPNMKLGVVAQHYPWDGMLDVECWVRNTPDVGYQIKVTATLPDGTAKSETFATRVGIHKLAFDAQKAFGEISLSGVKVRAELEKVVP